MKLYFKRAELLLHEANGKFVLEMAGKVIESFTSEKRAMGAYNRIRRDLEEKLPPAEVSGAERLATLEQYVANNIGYSSKFPAQRKIGRTRTFG